jgi:diaminopimelate epimerase
MLIQFWKMHGSSNDFILVDDRKMEFPASDKGWVTRISARKTGVGCEGIVLIQPSRKHDFRMRFFNPDGTEVSMCGNGARCVAKLANQLGIAPERMTIETVAGSLKAEILGDDVRLEMMTPKNLRVDGALKVAGKQMQYGYVVAGVPHVVIEVENIDECDVQAMGSRIRHHADFAPGGTNADFISVLGPQMLKVRTYERGVEAETLACGTGVVASAIIAAKRGRVTAPVKVLVASRDILTVDFHFARESVENVTLLGPAVHVYRGILEY